MRQDVRDLDLAGPPGSARETGAPRPVAVPVARRRTWRVLDQGVVVVVMLASFIGIAVAKPWDGGEQPAVAVPTAAPTQGPSPSATLEPTPPPAGTARGRREQDHRVLGDAVRVLRSRYGWGIRALVDDTSITGADERAKLHDVWIPAPSGGRMWWSWGSGPVETEVLVLPRGRGEVRALGVTSPPQSPLLDVRAWRMTGGGTRLAAQRIDGVPASAILLLPPGYPITARRWEPGLYRLDVLTAREVRRITVIVRGDDRPRPPQPMATPYSTEALLAAMDAVPPGLVVVRSPMGPHRGRPIAERRDSRPAPALDEADAWFALGLGDAGSPVHEFAGPGLGRTVVALGVRVAGHQEVRGARLTRYGTDEPPLEATVIASAGEVGGPGVLFEAGPNGFGPGTYRIDLRMADASGTTGSGSHHLELRAEGASPIASPLLRAIRRQARLAGEWSILGGVEPRGVIRPLGRLPDPDALGPTCRGGVMVPGENKVVGVGFPVGAAEDAVVARLFEGGRHVTLGATVADDSVAGLAVLAPREAGSWPWGYYAVTLRDGDRTRVLPFCVGEATPEGLRVPEPAAGLDAYFFVLGHAFFDP